jgi:hypothetical protein
LIIVSLRRFLKLQRDCPRDRRDRVTARRSLCSQGRNVPDGHCVAVDRGDDEVSQ